MGEEIPQIEDGIVQIIAKDRFPQVLDEDAADRRAVVEDAAVMAGAGPELVALLGVIDQRAEERRLERVGVLRHPGDEVPGDEFRRLLREEDVAVDEVEQLDRDVFQPLAADHDDDRHLQAAPAHHVDERGGLALQAALSPIHHEAADRGIGLHGDRGVLDAPRPHHLEAARLDRRDDLLDPRALQIIRIKGGGAHQHGEAAVKIHGAGLSSRTGCLPFRPIHDDSMTRAGSGATLRRLTAA
jgi:hypothetical protein